VVAYRAWADQIRLEANRNRWPHRWPVLQGRIRTVFYLPFPRSYTERKREGLRGQPHQSRPDGDNLHKAVLDALFKDDAFIWDGQYTSYWDDGQGPRAEIALQ
jgi:Holliday junction resolvase RusA-like endonuclease